MPNFFSNNLHDLSQIYPNKHKTWHFYAKIQEISPKTQPTGTLGPSIVPKWCPKKKPDVKLPKLRVIDSSLLTCTQDSHVDTTFLILVILIWFLPVCVHVVGRTLATHGGLDRFKSALIYKLTKRTSPERSPINASTRLAQFQFGPPFLRGGIPPFFSATAYLW